jgi:hypothetical protein
VTGQVGTERTFFITVTGCVSSTKQPSLKVADGRLPPGTTLFDVAPSTGPINGVPTTAGSCRLTVQVKDETRATDTETFTIQILPPGADEHHRGALGRHRRRVLPLWQPVGRRWGPALQLVGGRRGAGCWPGAAEAGERHLGNATTAGALAFTVGVTDDLGAFSDKALSVMIR